LRANAWPELGGSGHSRARARDPPRPAAAVSTRGR